MTMPDNTQWLTPTDILTRVDAVMGGIDLDPCANSLRPKHVPSTHCYTKEDDGLTRPWQGRVFMNPPYARGVIDPFVDKFINELSSGRMKSGIALVNADTSTRWFRRLAIHADVIGFFSPRLKFVHADTLEQAKGSQPRPQAVIGFHVSPRLFDDQFVDLCWMASTRYVPRG